MKKILRYFTKHRDVALFVLIAIAYIALRAFDLERRLVFGWDQVRDAWVMKDLVVNHRFPLAGPTVRGNSVLGPAYYYLLLPFYAASGLNPIGSGIFTVVMGTLTLITLFLAVRNIFSSRTALITSFLYTVSLSVMVSDRVSWNVTLLPLDAIFVFWFLYRIMRGETRLLPWLALAAGFGFHLHFTAVFFVGIILLCLPFMIRKKDFVKHALIAAVVGAMTFIPYLLYLRSTYTGTSYASTGFFNTYYLGFHLRRMLQITNDAFIQVEIMLYFRQLRWASIVLPFVYGIVLWMKQRKKSLPLVWLTAVWFVVPWIVMAVYGGEISDYYFIITRPLAVIIIAYLADALLAIPGILPGIAVGVMGLFYAYFNIAAFTDRGPSDFMINETKARGMADHSEHVEFKEGVPEVYLFHLYTKWKFLND